MKIENKKRFINRYLILTLLPRFAFGIPILYIGLRNTIILDNYVELYLSIAGVTIFLEIIYYIIHYSRLYRIIDNMDYESFYKTPLLNAIHTGLNFLVFAPIIETIINSFTHMFPFTEFIKGITSVLAVGIIEFGLIYCIGYLLLVPYFKTIKGTHFKGLSITQKLMAILIPIVIFAVYNGYIFTKSWVGILYLLLPAFLLYAAIRFIKEPIDSLLDGFDKFLSDNPDLSMRVVVVSGDELESLTVKFHEFLKIMDNIIKSINESASEVHQEAATLSAGVEEVTASSEEISSSIEEINRNSQDINEKISQVKHHSENLSSISSQIESQMQILNNIAKKSVKLANTGEEISENAVKGIKESYEKMQKSTDSLETLQNSFEEVKGFTSMMEAVSEDTSLLALNASVEAARVGDESKGFTVIADEIRKLSNDSSSYLENMRTSIKRMNESVTNVVSVTNENKDISQQSKGQVENTQEKLTEISESIAMTMNMAEQVTDILKEELQSIKEITEAVSKMTELTSQLAASTEEISAATQEQTASMEETDALAEKLLLVGDKMIEGIKKYID